MLKPIDEKDGHQQIKLLIGHLQQLHRNKPAGLTPIQNPANKTTEQQILTKIILSSRAVNMISLMQTWPQLQGIIRDGLISSSWSSSGLLGSIAFGGGEALQMKLVG